jgi:methionyl-tRNA formyltransferase
MRIVFLGTGEIGVPSLEALAEGGSHEVSGVFTQPDRPAGRAMKLRPSPIKVAAKKLGIPVFQPEKIRASDAVEQLKKLAPEVIVVAAYGQILPRVILDLPPRGCLNIHASLLPRHRGASPINAAILAGDDECGITIMQMDEGLDTGDILFKSAVAIEPDETAGRLHDRLGRLAPDVLLATLECLGQNTAKPEKQDSALATYAAKLSRKDGEIDWRKPAEEVDRQIRGLTPWPGAFTYLPGSPPVLLKIHRAVPVSGRDGEPGLVLDVQEGILVAAGRDAMRLQEVQAAGGKPLKTEEFLRGRRLAPGVSRLGR